MENPHLIDVREIEQDSNTKESFRKSVTMGYLQQIFVIVNPQHTDTKKKQLSSDRCEEVPSARTSSGN